VRVAFRRIALAATLQFLGHFVTPLRLFARSDSDRQKSSVCRTRILAGLSGGALYAAGSRLVGHVLAQVHSLIPGILVRPRNLGGACTGLRREVGAPSPRRSRRPREEETPRNPWSVCWMCFRSSYRLTRPLDWVRNICAELSQSPTRHPLRWKPSLTSEQIVAVRSALDPTRNSTASRASTIGDRSERHVHHRATLRRPGATGRSRSCAAQDADCGG